MSAPESQDQEIDELRSRIGRMLADGLETRTEPFPKLDEERYRLMAELRELAADDLKGRLVLGGFTDRHFGPASMNSAECVYYLARRNWCDLPELAMPVEPHWWCRLWRL